MRLSGLGRLLLAAALAAQALSASADEAFVNGEMLFRLCTSQQKLQAAPANELVNPESAYEAYECRFYVAGVADAISVMKPYKHCIPKSTKADDLVRAVFEFLQRNHQYYDQSGFKVTLSAIVSAYRCVPEK